MEVTIKDAPNYTISKCGTVRNTMTGRALRPRSVGYKGTCSSMYRQFRLRVNGRYITKYQHRLLAEAYIPNPDSLDTVDHIDGDKSNNSLDNLEWVSRSENSKRAYNAGLIYMPYEHIAGKSKGLSEGVTTIPKGSRAKLSEAEGDS